MSVSRRLPFVATALLIASSACSGNDRPAPASAKRITDRAELIGGPGALGDVGDYLLENGQIRVIIQAEGYSRGFGVYGGGIIDADLVRPTARGESNGGSGFDNFGELFPAIFLSAVAPNSIETKVNDDDSASVIVKGKTEDFLLMLETLNGVVLGDGDLLYQNEFRITPGKRYIEIKTTVLNPQTQTVEFPGPGIDALTGGAPLVIPVGDILLFGAGNHVFTEQAGYDIRFTLEDLYEVPPELPAFPGLLVPFIASTNENVSYGFMNGDLPPERSFIERARAGLNFTSTTAPGNAAYAEAGANDMVVPFIFSAFTGAFTAAAPKELRARESFTYTRYFMVGNGDVASIRDTAQEIEHEQCLNRCAELRTDLLPECRTQCDETHTPGYFAGTIRDAQTLGNVEDVSIVTFDARGQAYNQHTTDEDGTFHGTYEPGVYTYRIVAEGRFTTEPTEFEVKAGETTFVQPMLAAPGYLNLRVVDNNNRPLPSRCMVMASYGEEHSGDNPMDFLHDLRVGEHRRPTDLVPDTTDPATRQFIEKTIFVPNGFAHSRVRPRDDYRVVCTHGPEYELFEASPVSIRSGQTTAVDVVIPRAFETKGWISGDFHLHAVNSLDSYYALEDRVVAAAADGLDLAVSTDHNYVTNYAPTIERLDLVSWLQSMVGLEMTTLEIGHFNGYPLEYNPGPITKGAFEWAGRPPKDLFDDIRALGAYGAENTVVQCNHPRDTILGYFNDYYWNQDSGEAEENESLLLATNGPEFGPDNFDLGFDSIEIYNGKRFELIRNYRVPETLPPPPLPDNIPPAGTVLRDSDGKISFPGGLDDWFRLLEIGQLKTAVGNSDSHNSEDETGYPRTYVPVSDDRPGAIPELDVVKAMKQQRAVATNAPFISVFVGTAGIGDVANASSGQATVNIEVLAASWVKLDRVNVFLNGESVAQFTGNNESLRNLTATVTIDRDSWVVVEAGGSESMWPVIAPQEIPSIQISDAVGSLAGSFGLDLNPYGNLQPALVFTVPPYGFTNPVYLDFDGNGRYDPPGGAQRALRAELAKDGPRVSAQKVDSRQLPKLLRIFSAFAHGDQH